MPAENNSTVPENAGETVPATTAPTPEPTTEKVSEPSAPEPSLKIPISEPSGTTPGDVPKRGRGRPPGTGKNQLAAAGDTPKPPEMPSQAEAEKEKMILGSAGMTFDMATGTLSQIFGGEWQPRAEFFKDDAGNVTSERDFMVKAIADYYRVTGIKEMSPKMLLAFAVASYSLPRFSHPNTSGKIKLFFMWLKMKFGGIFGRKKG